MRDAINIAVLKTLNDWGVPKGQLREAIRLLKTATEEELKSAWIVALAKPDVIHEDIVRLGCKAGGLEYDEERGGPVVPLGIPDYLEQHPEEREAFVRKIAEDGRKAFKLDSKRHFEYRLVTDKDELAALTTQEGVDCRVHSLHRHVTETRKRAQQMGFIRGTRKAS